MEGKTDYQYMVGRKYGMLTVTEALPRERGPKGNLKPARVMCHCDCGNDISIKASMVLEGKRKHCGCVKKIRKPLQFSAEVETKGSYEDETPAIIKQLHATWVCTNNENSGCLRNEAAGLCCRECDKYDGCAMACKNFPTVCGAKRRHKIKPPVVKTKQCEVVETCPNCDREVTLVWDVRVEGFKAFCPYCGERLMLCDECQHRFDNGEFTDDCDYNGYSDTCRFNCISNKVKDKYIASIRKKLSKRTLLEGLAEEASELAKAAMKVIRAEGINNNITPVTPKTAFCNLVEEYGDVITVASVLGIKPKDNGKKLERWAIRLSEVQKDEGKEVPEENQSNLQG